MILMENSHGKGVKNIHFLLLLLITFSSSSCYEIPKKYFINCGSGQAVNDTGSNRIFAGDEKPAGFAVSKEGSSVAIAATATNASLSPIYRTARIFRRQSSYTFKTSGSAASAYVLRLHFLAFASPVASLAAAAFDVAATPGFVLLHNFTAGNTPLVKEFFVIPAAGKFRVLFTPRNSSLAYINAVEFFLAPAIKFPSFPVLATVYRVNMGGDKIDPKNDPILRNWDTDDEFLETKHNAQNKTFSGRINFPSDERQFAAPKPVYNTAKEMNDSRSDVSINITWRFDVNQSSRHVVRAHFCTIISETLLVVHFNLYINGGLVRKMNSADYCDPPRPVYFDFPIGSPGSSVLRVSVGPAHDTEVNNAFLNGVEILEVKDGSAFVPVEKVGSGSKVLHVVLGSGLAGLAVVSALLGGFFVISRRKKARPAENSSWGNVTGLGRGSTHSRAIEATINGSHVPYLYLGLKLSLSEINLATKRFDPDLVIGRGGFGVVYKGVLADGTAVAVKRSAPGSGQGFMEFETEITILSKIRHRHLVSLIGYCDEQGEMILVYEFMEKGTLRDHLYDSNLPRLSWKQRLEVCIGAAGGLNYLHKGSSVTIIHRDVKSTNILLDANYVAKVADFGLSKSNALGDTEFSTNVKGTPGYLDPEYLFAHQLSEKSDVYSFGVVLLEVLCARQPIDQALPWEQMNLAKWAMHCKSQGMLEEIIDPAIKGQLNPNSLRKFVEAAEKCLHEEASERPEMRDVLWDLDYAKHLQQAPATREPYEDSTATGSAFASSAIAGLPDIQHLPSLGSLNDDSYVVT